MDRKMLRDDQWERIEQLLPGKASDRGVIARMAIDCVGRRIQSVSPG